MIKSLDEYRTYYEKYGKTIDQMSIPNKSLNQKQLSRKYDKYVLKMEKLDKKRQGVVESVDHEWNELKEKLTMRDGYKCKLSLVINDEALNMLENKSGGLHKQLDMAHVFPKGSYKFLYYDLDDVVWLNRYSHSMLDSNRNPITGKPIDQIEKEAWWRLIVGNEVYDRLQEKIERSKV